jgi:hypothetical protein
MTPRATRMLSVGVLTLPICVPSRDILGAIGAHQRALLAPLVVSDDNRRKNGRQRAPMPDNLTDLDAESRPPWE